MSDPTTLAGGAVVLALVALIINAPAVWVGARRMWAWWRDRHTTDSRTVNARLLRLADGNPQLEALFGLREQHERAQHEYGSK